MGQNDFSACIDVVSHQGNLHNALFCGCWMFCVVYIDSFYQIDHSRLWWTVVGINKLMMCQGCCWEFFWARQCCQQFVTPLSCFPQFRCNYQAFRTLVLLRMLHYLDTYGGVVPLGVFPLFLKTVADIIAPSGYQKLLYPEWPRRQCVGLAF